MSNRVAVPEIRLHGIERVAPGQYRIAAGTAEQLAIKLALEDYYELNRKWRTKARDNLTWRQRLHPGIYSWELNPDYDWLLKKAWGL